MSSRGGIIALNNLEHNKSANIPVSAKVVKASLKSIILNGESDLEKFVTHRFLFYYGFLTGWNPQIFSLEIIPILYFLIWSIVLFAIRENNFAYLFLSVGIFLFFYFLLLHSVISSWDKIKRWFIKRARKSGGIQNMTLQDVKMLLIYTRKVFGVKATIDAKPRIEFSIDNLRKQLSVNRKWQTALNISIILELMLISAGGIYGFIIELDLLNWIINWWYIILIILIPLLILIIGLSVSKYLVREMINTIPAEQFDDVLKILNEFKVFGGPAKN
ncbi:MAG: hypothetical protein JXA54_14365 [Candidatus Heimdallarchaeota archaeon]|nr:hypothetical protein [Candidatus Heimdallarchaeota archaeon]